MPDDLEAKRQTAAYADTTNRLRHTTELPDGEIDRLALAAVETSVFGHDAKKDRKGNYLQQGVGAPGFETGNHFSSILRYQGREHYEKAVREIWARDPKRAAALNLPKVT
jgi:hypothetical protein